VEWAADELATVEVRKSALEIRSTCRAGPQALDDQPRGVKRVDRLRARHFTPASHELGLEMLQLPTPCPNVEGPDDEQLGRQVRFERRDPGGEDWNLQVGRSECRYQLREKLTRGADDEPVEAEAGEPLGDLIGGSPRSDGQVAHR